jgi:hypothetical protein
LLTGEAGQVPRLERETKSVVLKHTPTHWGAASQMGREMRSLIGAFTAAAIGLATASPAEAAPCSLDGRWDAFLTLSHLDDATDQPWPPDTTICTLHIEGDGSLHTSSECDGVAFLEGSDLKLNQSCRTNGASEIYLEMKVPMAQTQDQYRCRLHGTMAPDGMTVHGLLDCGYIAEPFTMVRQ